MTAIRVLIADDQALVRAGFRMILDAEDDLDVIGEASDGMEAVDATRRLKPDVVLMDIRMPGLDGIEATRRVLASAGDDGSVRVLMLTTFDLNEYVYDALRAGASRLPAQGRAARAARRRHPRRRARRRAARPVDHPAADPGVRPGRPAVRPAAEGPGRADRARARGLQAGRPRPLQRRDRRRADRQRDDGQDPCRAAADEARPARPCAGRRARLRGGHRRSPGAAEQA